MARKPREATREKATKPLHKQGKVPRCLGRYLAGDIECDGNPACSWRSGCREYVDYTKAIGVVPEIHNFYTPTVNLRSLVIALLQEAKHRASYAPKTQKARISRGWERFIETFKENTPFAIPVYEDRSRALPGELYYAAWKTPEDNPDQFAYVIRVKGHTTTLWGDRVIVRYIPTFASRVEPTIEIRTDMKNLSEKYPQIRFFALRWKSVAVWSKATNPPLGATAIRVRTECIEDIARLAARLLTDNEIREVTAEGGTLVIDQRRPYSSPLSYSKYTLSDNKTDATLKFGKYKGRSVSSIARTDEGVKYLNWIRLRTQFPEELHNIISRQLRRRQG